MGGGGDEASATTKKIFNDEPTTLLKRDYVNEFAIKTIKDKKQYVINFSDDFDPNPNISSDLACSRYERMKLKDPDNKSNRIAPDILMVQIKLLPLTNSVVEADSATFGKQKRVEFTMADKKHFMRDIEKAILNMYPEPYLN